eukprot:8618947-Pyramimonas_sp.AAC.1
MSSTISIGIEDHDWGSGQGEITDARGGEQFLIQYCGADAEEGQSLAMVFAKRRIKGKQQPDANRKTEDGLLTAKEGKKSIQSQHVVRTTFIQKAKNI